MTLPGPSRRIRVEPLPKTAPAPEPRREPAKPAPKRTPKKEPVPA